MKSKLGEFARRLSATFGAFGFVGKAAVITMKRRIIGGVLLVLAAGFVVSAQTGAATTTGKLSGLVVDSAGATVPNAKIVVESEGFRREVVSADDGRYKIELPIGKYLVTVVREDFNRTEVTGVVIEPNALTKLDVALYKGIAIHEEFVPEELLRTETPMLNTTIQLRKLLRQP